MPWPDAILYASSTEKKKTPHAHTDPDAESVIREDCTPTANTCKDKIASRRTSFRSLEGLEAHTPGGPKTKSSCEESPSFSPRFATKGFFHRGCHTSTMSKKPCNRKGHNDHVCPLRSPQVAAASHIGSLDTSRIGSASSFDSTGRAFGAKPRKDYNSTEEEAQQKRDEIDRRFTPHGRARGTRLGRYVTDGR